MADQSKAKQISVKINIRKRKHTQPLINGLKKQREIARRCSIDEILLQYLSDFIFEHTRDKQVSFDFAKEKTSHYVTPFAFVM